MKHAACLFSILALILFLAPVFVALGFVVPAVAQDGRERDRAMMVSVIKDYAPSLEQQIGAQGFDTKVLAVMGRLPRERFVPEDVAALAYADRPLRIGYGQTISQPLIVAFMTHLLAVEPDDVVLEIGTGSGYQAAVLSGLAAKVCSVEIIPQLGRRAARLFDELGLDNVETRVADGYHGWPDCGPFDGIMVTAASSHIPPPLLAQLKPGAKMILPVGGPYGAQYLVLIDKDGDGRLTTRQVMPVRFVPLTR